VCIVELYHLLIDFEDKTPLTPMNERVEETLDTPDIEECKEIGMGVLVEGMEDA